MKNCLNRWLHDPKAARVPCSLPLGKLLGVMSLSNLE